MGPSGVVRRVAADRAGLLARGVGGKVQPGARKVPCQIQIHDPRPDPGDTPFNVDFMNLVHPRGRYHHRVVAWNGTSREACTRSAWNEVAAVGDSSPDAVGDLFGRIREADGPTVATVDYRAVTAVEVTGSPTYEDPVGSDRRHQVSYQFIGSCGHLVDHRIILSVVSARCRYQRVRGSQRWKV